MIPLGMVLAATGRGETSGPTIVFIVTTLVVVGIFGYMVLRASRGPVEPRSTDEEAEEPQDGSTADGDQQQG